MSQSRNEVHVSSKPHAELVLELVFPVETTALIMVSVVSFASGWSGIE